MPKQTFSDRQYRERAKKLRSLGYKVGKKLTPQTKAAITRRWYDHAFYYATDPEGNRFEFKKFRSSGHRRNLLRATAKEQQFPGGVYVQRPMGIEKGAWKYRANRDGTITIRAKKGGKQIVNDLVIPLDMAEFQRDTRSAIENALKGKKRARQLMLTVNGIESRRFDDLQQFENYTRDELIPKLEAKQFDFDKWGQEVFGLRLVYTPSGGRKTKGEGKTFDFKTGGIFDEHSKRVYGRKKFTAKETWKPKQGKRKGR